MATLLREVLTAFETSRQPRTLNQLARELDMAPGMLEGMLEYWVRKGRLRESSGASMCATCGGAGGCPFVPQLPRSYELATNGSSPETDPPCGCCG